MIRQLISFLLLAVVATAFTSPACKTNSQWGMTSKSIGTTQSLFMFSGDQDKEQQQQQPKPLEVVETATTAAAAAAESVAPVVDNGETESQGKTKAVYRNLARGGEIESVQWVDDAMEANENPFLMSWWAYPLFGFPFILLANDAFHFLPEDGPLGFLTKL